MGHELTHGFDDQGLPLALYYALSSGFVISLLLMTSVLFIDHCTIQFCCSSFQVVNMTRLVCYDRGGAKSQLHGLNSVLSASTTNIQPTLHTAKT